MTKKGSVPKCSEYFLQLLNKTLKCNTIQRTLSQKLQKIKKTKGK